MNIYQIERESLPFTISEDILDYLTVNGGRGIKTDDYWIINATTQIYNDPNKFDRELHKFNTYLHKLNMQGFISLMILKEKAPVNTEASTDYCEDIGSPSAETNETTSVSEAVGDSGVGSAD